MFDEDVVSSLASVFLSVSCSLLLLMMGAVHGAMLRGCACVDVSWARECIATQTLCTHCILFCSTHTHTHTVDPPIHETLKIDEWQPFSCLFEQLHSWCFCLVHTLTPPLVDVHRLVLSSPPLRVHRRTLTCSVVCSFARCFKSVCVYVLIHKQTLVL